MVCGGGAGNMMEARGDLPQEETDHFMGSGRCALCHDGGGSVLRSRQGEDLSIVRAWSGTMMANSARDPYWRAKVDREIEERPALRGLLEDKCTRCHAPMGHTEARLTGWDGWSLAALTDAPVASDGVSCTLCHQIRAEGLGTEASYTGGFTVGLGREIFGPYDDVLTMPMRRHVDYTPKFGRQVQDSGLCGTCHTLFTPILARDGTVTGAFPEQTTYLEWKSSVHAGENRHCQDCHMPRVDEVVKMSRMPPWLDGRSPFWRHTFVGGNTLVPALLRDHRADLGTAAEDEQLSAVVERAKDQLCAQAISLAVRGRLEGGELRLEVTVGNRTGHKFPTGFPSRRAWLHVTVRAPGGRVLFESGAYDGSGRLVSEGGPFQPHYVTIRRPEQAQVYESVMGDADGRATTVLLSATRYLKDNRIPPRGFGRDGRTEPAVATHGVSEEDVDFNRDDAGRGAGSDTTLYRTTVGEEARRVRVSVEVLYQSLKPAFVDHLLQGHGEAIRRLEGMLSGADLAPVVVAAVQGTVRAGGGWRAEAGKR